MSGILTVSQLNATNLRLDTNTISSTNINGNITLNPNGTGVIQPSSNVIPDADGVYDIGSTLLKFNDIHCNNIYGNIASSGNAFGNIQVGTTNDNTLDTTTGNLIIDSFTGTTNINDAVIINDKLTVDDILIDGQTITAQTGSLNLISSTDNISIIPAGANGVNITNYAAINGQTRLNQLSLDFRGGNASLTTYAGSNGNITLTPDGTGQVFVNNLSLKTNTLTTSTGNLILNATGSINTSKTITPSTNETTNIGSSSLHHSNILASSFIQSIGTTDTFRIHSPSTAPYNNAYNVLQTLEARDLLLEGNSNIFIKNSNLLPFTTAIRNLGSNALRWNYLFNKGIDIDSNYTIAGNGSDIEHKAYNGKNILFSKQTSEFCTFNLPVRFINDQNLNFMGTNHKIESVQANAFLAIVSNQILTISSQLNDIRLFPGAGKVITPSGDSINPLYASTTNMGYIGNPYRDMFANSFVIVSDENIKENIIDVPVGLDFINQLQPRQFKYKDYTEPDKMDETKTITHTYVRNHWGFIAQEIKQALDLNNIDSGVFVDGSVEDPTLNTRSTKGIRMEQLISPLVKAVQELTTLINQQQIVINGLNDTITTMQAQITNISDTVINHGDVLVEHDTRLDTLEAV